MQDDRDARIAELEAALAQRDALIAELSAKLAELESRLNRDSDNSHKPPSTDKPWKQRTPKEPSGKKPGGQPGHPGHHRPMLPPEQVDKTVPLFPDQCGHCHADLADQPVIVTRSSQADRRAP